MKRQFRGFLSILNDSGRGVSTAAAGDVTDFLSLLPIYHRKYCIQLKSFCNASEFAWIEFIVRGAGAVE
jgi:hypothetical protein